MRTVVIEAIYAGADAEDVEIKDWCIRIAMNLNENNSPIFAGYLAGVRGTPFGKYECYPFVVNQKGRVDFGSNFVTREDEPTAEVDARYGSTNILHKTIEVGETFNMTENDEDNTYKIRRVIPV